MAVGRVPAFTEAVGPAFVEAEAVGASAGTAVGIAVVVWASGPVAVEVVSGAAVEVAIEVVVGGVVGEPDAFEPPGSEPDRVAKYTAAPPPRRMPIAAIAIHALLPEAGGAGTALVAMPDPVGPVSVGIVGGADCVGVVGGAETMGGAEATATEGAGCAGCATPGVDFCVMAGP